MTYRVEHGWQEQKWEEFPTWEQALLFGRGMRRVYRSLGDKRYTVSIYNQDKRDEGTTGLTDEQRAEWEP